MHPQFFSAILSVTIFVLYAKFVSHEQCTKIDAVCMIGIVQFFMWTHLAVLILTPQCLIGSRTFSIANNVIKVRTEWKFFQKLFMLNTCHGTSGFHPTAWPWISLVMQILENSLTFNYISLISIMSTNILLSSIVLVFPLKGQYISNTYPPLLFFLADCSFGMFLEVPFLDQATQRWSDSCTA